MVEICNAGAKGQDCCIEDGGSIFPRISRIPKDDSHEPSFFLRVGQYLGTFSLLGYLAWELRYKWTSKSRMHLIG